MTTLKAELIEYINDIPDEKLVAIKPLLTLLSNESLTIEKVDFESLSDIEKQSILDGEREYINGETVSHDNINWN